MLGQALGLQVVPVGSGVGSSMGPDDFGAGFWGVQKFKPGGFLNCVSMFSSNPTFLYRISVF